MVRFLPVNSHESLHRSSFDLQSNKEEALTHWVNFFLSRSLGPTLWFKGSVPPLPGPQSYLGLNQLHIIFLFSSRVGPEIIKIQLSKIYLAPANSASRFPGCICHFTSYKRIGYSGWPWKVSGGTEEESGWSFSGLVSVVWVCCPVFMHAANVGHTRNYSGNLRRLVVSILQIHSVRTPDSLAAKMLYICRCTTC